MAEKKEAAAPTEEPSVAAEMAELSKAAREATGREEALCAVRIGDQRAAAPSLGRDAQRPGSVRAQGALQLQRHGRPRAEGGSRRPARFERLDDRRFEGDHDGCEGSGGGCGERVSVRSAGRLVRRRQPQGRRGPVGYLGDITTQLAGSQFTQSHQQYLESIGATGPFKQDEAQPAGDITYPGEEGADSIADLCNFYDWREDACRSIFYISDTALDGYSAFYDAAASNATAAALANGVVLFAHKIPGGDPLIEASYDKMTGPTGGSAYHGPVDAAKYVELLKNAICKACGSECRALKLPDIKPCLSISWGNSECDCFETDDTEIAYISACNCYSNITLANLHISYLVVTMEDGSPVPALPDGTPSVQIAPLGPICFGDIPPCREGREQLRDQAGRAEEPRRPGRTVQDPAGRYLLRGLHRPAARRLLRDRFVPGLKAAGARRRIFRGAAPAPILSSVTPQKG